MGIRGSVDSRLKVDVFLLTGRRFVDVLGHPHLSGGAVSRQWLSQNPRIEDETVSVLDALIVGAGRSGLRFLRAALVAQPAHVALRIRTVIDENRSRLTAIEGNSIACVSSLEDAICLGPYDLIVLCVNESRRYSVFEELAARGVATKRIISEKPLTETLTQAEFVERRFDGTPIVVNFVERASRVVSEFRNWLRDNNHVVKRATFFWGKNRIGDRRPTIGVLSELSHPIDLVLHLADVAPGSSYRVLAAHGTSSRLSSHTQVYDTLHIGITVENGPLIDGSSSYTWPSRDRRLLVFSGLPTGPATHLSVLIFDQPIWDLDSLHIFDLARDPGRMVDVHRLRIRAADIPEERLTIHKVTRFLETAIEELNRAPSGNLADLRQAMYVQRILHDIDVVAATTNRSWRDAFSNTAASKEVAIHHTEIAIRKMLLREPLQHEDYIWDDGY